MGREEFEVVNSSGVLKRKQKRRVALLINGTGLDRATRRLEKKVDMSNLVKGLTSGIEIEMARYYTLVPYEDDARQVSFLDAITRANLEVISKRLPPKGVKRQVSMDVHMASDLITFAFGKYAKNPDENVKRVVCVVCPGRELNYAIYQANELGVETTLADFGLYGQTDGWNGVDRWVDLSTSETIWR